MQNYSYENVCHCTFIRAPSGKEANDNLEVEGQSAYYEPSQAHQGDDYPGFCSLKRRPGVFLLSPGWDANPSRVTSYQYPFIHLIGEGHCGSLSAYEAKYFFAYL